MCQHNSSNNDSALISATDRLTVCLTTMERTKICESWKHLEAQFKRKSFQEDSREWPLFCERYGRSFVMLQSERLRLSST